MTTFHVHHRFHPVGHGTFFTGVVWVVDEEVGESAFRWVYDCGSKRHTRVGEAIDALGEWGYGEHWPPDVTVDLVAVSHFDDDHVNGLERFLARYRVKWLVLPYIGLKQRLAHAASLGGGDVVSAATAAFAIDPLGFLAARGLSERVGGVLFVEGGADGVSDLRAPLSGLPGPDRSGALPDGDHARIARAYPIDALGAATGFRPQVRLMSHTCAVTAGDAQMEPMEFAFYNTALPDGRANRSKKPIGAVADEVASLLARYGVLDPLRKPRPGWRDQLKACYSRHFGSSGPERNDISLCVLVRQLTTSAAQPCGWFAQGVGSVRQVPFVQGPQALLLTGDLTLNADVIAELRAHFGDWRWRQLRVAQVPHHGSRHSWKQGNAGLFPAPAFVQCVPTIRGKVPHPHPSVVADLSGSEVHVANYEQSVVQTYHFDI